MAINWIIIGLLLVSIAANIFQWKINLELYAEIRRLKKNFIRSLAGMALAQRLKADRSDPEGD